VIAVHAVHLDLDGVLVDSRDSIVRAWRQWAADKGVAWAKLARHIEGRLAVDTIAAVLPELDEPELQAEADRVNDIQVHDADDDTAVPGMRAFVDALAGHPWSVVTGAPRRLAEARLSRCGYPRPPVLVAAEDVTVGKPDPEGYLIAAARLGVPVRRSLVVEDSAAGIQAGRAAGATVLALAPPQSRLAALAHVAVPDGRGVRVRTGTHGLRVDVTTGQAGMLGATPAPEGAYE
jgi:sugar-phosphatase